MNQIIKTLAKWTVVFVLTGAAIYLATRPNFHLGTDPMPLIFIICAAVAFVISVNT